MSTIRLRELLQAHQDNAVILRRLDPPYRILAEQLQIQINVLSPESENALNGSAGLGHRGQDKEDRSHAS